MTDNSTMTDISTMTNNSTMTDNSIKTENFIMTDDAASDAANDADCDNFTNEDIAAVHATNVYAIIAAQNDRFISAADKALIKFMASKK